MGAPQRNEVLGRNGVVPGEVIHETQKTCTCRASGKLKFLDEEEDFAGNNLRQAFEDDDASTTAAHATLPKRMTGRSYSSHTGFYSPQRPLYFEAAYLCEAILRLLMK